MLASGRPGFCSVTHDKVGSECLPTDSKGSWSTARRLATCVSKCRACERCHFISYSRLYRDCSWFAECPDQLQLSIEYDKGYIPRSHSTWRIRHDNGTLLNGAGLASKQKDASSPIATAVKERIPAASQSEQAQVESVHDAGVCIGDKCVSWVEAYAAVRVRGGSGAGWWLRALPSPPSNLTSEPCMRAQWEAGLRGRELCSALPSRHPGPAFNLSRAWASLDASTLRSARLNYLHDASSSAAVARRAAPKGWVPTLSQSLFAANAYRRSSQMLEPALAARQLACSMARHEDAAVLRSFFSDESGALVPFPPDATFLEMGAVNGVTESVSYLFEKCLGWRGVLVEANPDVFAELTRNRPYALNLRVAACDRHGYTNFGIADAITTSSAAPASNRSGATMNAANAILISTQCGPLGDYLKLLAVRSLDFLTLDVEGTELVVAESLNIGVDLAVGVLMIEVRGDGLRPKLLAHLLSRGLVYVGSIHARASPSNEVVSDVFVNLTHMQQRFPSSRLLASGSPSSSSSSGGGGSRGSRGSSGSSSTGGSNAGDMGQAYASEKDA
jgi:FkbM family methyltransferase